MSDGNQPDAIRSSRFSLIGKLLIVLLLAGLVAGAAWWWWQKKDRARSLLQAEIDAVHARGEPVTRNEIEFFRRLPPGQNAFILYRQAADAVGALPVTVHGEADAWDSVSVLDNYPAWRREHADESAAFLAACRPALDLVRQARGMDGVPLLELPEYPRNLPARMDVFYPNVAHVRMMTRVCRLAAAMAHDAGDDREAFEHLLDMWQIRDRIGEHPTDITSLVQIAVTSLAAGCVERIAPTLKIGDGPGEVPAAEVRALAERLIQSDTLLVTAHRGMIVERVDLYEQARSGKKRVHDETRIHIETGARADISLATLLRLYSNLGPWYGNRYGRVDAVAQLIEGDVAWRERLESDSTARKTMESFETYLMAMLSKGRTLLYRGLATQRMAGVALLMRLHEVETGRPVETLDDLVPRYLPVLPEDPFSPTGLPLRYLPDGPYPRLYSVSDNQQDDGGDFHLRPDGSISGLLDWPFFLNNTRDQAEGRDEQPPDPKRGR